MYLLHLQSGSSNIPLRSMSVNEAEKEAQGRKRRRPKIKSWRMPSRNEEKHEEQSEDVRATTELLTESTTTTVADEKARVSEKKYYLRSMG